MKLRYLFIFAILAVLSVSCQEEFDEITEMNLTRCLTPTDLAARVDVATGVDVTFSWKVGKDADSYELLVYSDEEMTDEIFGLGIPAAEIPYSTNFLPDQTLYFKVRALSEKKQASGWAVFDGSFKTFAVASNLFPEITGRTATSVTMSWSKDFSDSQKVTHITCTPVRGGDAVTYELADADIAAGEATVEGLVPSTEYQVVLFLSSASCGGVDAWTMSDPTGLTSVSTSEALIAAMTAGNEIYLTLAGSPYAVGAFKAAKGFKIYGELGADGSKPVVSGNIDLNGGVMTGGEDVNIYVENVTFSDALAHNHIVNFSGTALTLGKIEFVNCDISAYKAGVLSANKDGKLTIGTISFDSCEFFGIIGSGADFFDVRKNAEITNIIFKNNTFYDGIRSLFRIDKATTVTIGTIDFQNNTLKNVCTMNDGNNRGLFAVRVAHNMTLKKNLFLWEDGGDAATPDKAQLFQDIADTVIPTLNASDNYTYAEGSAFFTKVDAATAGFTILDSDPCFNSKGNFFQLSNQDLISKKIGASKWWIPYAEPEEDLTQNALEGAHVWNLADASLFAGDVKNSRVRDELLLVGTEEVPMNADGGINFLSAAPLSKKGIPSAGYISFKVKTAGSVDLELGGSASGGVSVAIYDDNGFAVKGSAAVSSVAGVQKILVPASIAEGSEAVVYVYPTSAVSVKKLAWSLDTEGGNKILVAPQPVAEPVTVTEGDETEITFTWDAVPHAGAYAVSFNKKSPVNQTELSYTVPAATIAGLSAGLYTFTVKAVPVDGDIYYSESTLGQAAIAIQPKGGDGPITETFTWNFSDADWQTELVKWSTINSNFTADPAKVFNGLTFYSKTNSKWNKATIDNVDYYYVQFGGSGLNADSGLLDRYFKFTAPAAGTLKVTSSNTGSSEATDRMIYVKVGETVEQKMGGFASTAPQEVEFSVAGGDVIISTNGGGLRFLKIEFTCAYTPEPEVPVKFDWNFTDDDWQTELAKWGTINSNFTATDPAKVYNGLTFYSLTNSKWNKATIDNVDYYYVQFGGSGLNADTGNLDRYFKFTTPKAGTLKVKTSNTGSSEATDRMIYVKVGETVEQKMGGFASTAPQEVEFSVAAGDVYISTKGGALRFLEIHFSE